MWLTDTKPIHKLSTMTHTCHQYVKRVPSGDNRERDVCVKCGEVKYENPKIINVTVTVHEGKILLCRRAIEPGRGLWTLPGGYMEIGETIKEGSLREAFEEAGSRAKIGPLLGIYHSANKQFVHMVFRSTAISEKLSPGHESLEAKYFEWKDIPWDDLAFPMDRASLLQYNRTQHLKDFPPEIRTLPPFKSDVADKKIKKPKFG